MNVPAETGSVKPICTQIDAKGKVLDSICMQIDQKINF